MDERVTTKDFDTANRRAKRAIARGPVAVAARYDKARIIVDLENGCSFAFPVTHAQELVDASVADLKVIEITPSGLGLHWPNLDADLDVPSLVKGVLGTRSWMSRIGRAGGLAATAAKAEASRANGAKGGRPKAARLPAKKDEPSEKA